MKFRELFISDYFSNWDINWDVLDEIPQFTKLKSTPQSDTWHKEGSVFAHTLLVCIEMERILKENNISKDSNEWHMCMCAALCHDLGKAETTKWSDKKNDWETSNHGVVGERITRNLFFDEDIELRENVCYMVRHHMTLHHILDKKDKFESKLIKLSHGIVPIKYMLYLNLADSKGSSNDIESDEFLETKYNKIYEKSIELDCYDKPYQLKNKSELIRDFISYKGDIVNDKNDFCVYIMCGFPGCGKSTYISRYLLDKVVISRDIIRGELGIGGATIYNDKKVVGTKEEENKVSQIFNKKMIECCENKESFVLDNTNLKYQYRKDYLLKIMKYNPKVKIIYVEAPNFIDDCMDRRNGEIEKSVYDRMNDNFDFPQLYECDVLEIVKQDGEILPFEQIYTYPSILFNENKMLDDLKITRGAMILDGYDCYDSCIKFMDKLIKKYENKI